jgi:HEAT repeat protein
MEAVFNDTCSTIRGSAVRFAQPNVLKSLLVLILLVATGPARSQQLATSGDLVEQFKINRDFWQQFEVAEKLARLHDASVLEQLRPFLRDEDRHVRGNAAYVFAVLGDELGFETITAILGDRSGRTGGQGIPGAGWSLSAQISSDRYYAAHLLGDLRDVRAVPILVPLLTDHEVNWIVPWALGAIGEKAAVSPLRKMLRDPSQDMRVLSIYALVDLKAKEAIPDLRLLADDQEKIHFDNLETVADAAKTALEKLRALP